MEGGNGGDGSVGQGAAIVLLPLFRLLYKRATARGRGQGSKKEKGLVKDTDIFSHVFFVFLLPRFSRLFTPSLCY
jgi:hypothetical protein